jgi:hypothetical protein
MHLNIRATEECRFAYDGEKYVSPSLHTFALVYVMFSVYNFVGSQF